MFIQIKNDTQDLLINVDKIECLSPLDESKTLIETDVVIDKRQAFFVVDIPYEDVARQLSQKVEKIIIRR